MYSMLLAFCLRLILFFFRSHLYVKTADNYFIYIPGEEQ